jgi:hypothetical protein
MTICEHSHIEHHQTRCSYDTAVIPAPSEALGGHYASITVDQKPFQTSTCYLNVLEGQRRQDASMQLQCTGHAPSSQ